MRRYRHGYFDATGPRAVYLGKVNALREFVPDYAPSLAALALKFAAQPTGITTALTSMHIPEFTEANISAIDAPDLPEEIFDLFRTRYRFTKNFNNHSQWDTDSHWDSP